MRTYYDILSLPRTASAADIQSAFRRLAKLWHPDRNKRPDATARFREINEAYQCLRDPVLRSEYDAQIRRAEEPPREAYTRAGSGWQPPFEQTQRPSWFGISPAEWRALDALFSEFSARLTLDPAKVAAGFARFETWLRRTWRAAHSR